VSVERESGREMTRGVIKIAFLLILVIVAWSDGLAVGYYEWPPFSLDPLSIQDRPPAAECSGGYFIVLRHAGADPRRFPAKRANRDGRRLTH
jgi:hypothetical protein